jgi:IclR family acetate operon transcriptional repressor
LLAYWHLRNIVGKYAMADRVITSLDKGLQLLTALGSADEPLALATLARRFPWHKSTVYRTLETLKVRKFVELLDGGYVLGPAALALGRTVPEVPLLERARALMDKAAAHSCENAHLAIRSGDEMVFIDQRSGGRFTLHTEIGGREPLHCTAIGKAYLMTLAPNEVSRTLAHISFEPFTPKTLRNARALVADLKAADRRGYAVDDREYCDDVRCVAVPITDEGGNFVAALGVSAPASRVPPAKLLELGRLLTSLQESLSPPQVAL